MMELKLPKTEKSLERQTKLKDGNYVIFDSTKDQITSYNMICNTSKP